jgi:pSer/pThr/pTyr-binding forkhead associated (FHA) protein
MRVEEVTLQFLEGENEGVEIKLTPPRELYIGRSEDSDVFLGEKKISRKHTMIVVSEDQVRIVDMESTNGTFVNGKKISELELKTNDKVKIGSSMIQVKVQSTSEGASEAPTGAKDKKSTPPPKKKPEPKEVEKEESSLEVLSDDLEEEEIEEEPKKAPVKAPVKEAPKAAAKKPSQEEDSDLVVEYQTSIKEKPKVDTKAKDFETSEKISQAPKKKEEPKKVVEEEQAASDDDFQEFELDVEESKEKDIEASMDLEENDEASFDKIPDLDNLSSPEMDLNEEQPKSTKPLMGDLSSMGLSDLLQNLNQNKKSGVLSLESGSSKGKILIREGSLLSGQTGKAVGIKAIYRMLTWKTGDFEFQPFAADSEELSTDQDPIEDSVESILMEGFRQYDELRKIQKVLPAMDDELVLDDEPEVPISKLHPKVLDIFQLVLTQKKMKNILDVSPTSDLETSKIVFYLIKKKVIRIK